MNEREDRAIDIANRIQSVCEGEPAYAVYTALSMMIGAAAARAPRPDFDACMALVERTARHSYECMRLDS